MPGAADHRDLPETVLDGPAQDFAHVRLTNRVARAGFVSVAAQDRHGLGQRVEDRGRRDVLHHVLPPALRVLVAGRGGQFADRIGASSRWRLAAGHRQLVRGRQITEPDRDARVQRVPDRLPLRREHREGPERRLLRLPGHVAEQRHRRPHLRVRGQRDQPVRLRRSLDQHDVRALLLQGRPHRPRRPRSVMPDPVEDGRKILRPNGPWRVPRSSFLAVHPAASRQAR